MITCIKIPKRVLKNDDFQTKYVSYQITNIKNVFK